MFDTVAVVGATGAVGTIILQLLEQRKFPFKHIKFLASGRSAGKTIRYAGQDYTVEELTPAPEDVRLEVSGGDQPFEDGELALLDALAGQLLAFFRCLHGGGRPDSPSSGIIRRVVESFAIHAHE